MTPSERLLARLRDQGLAIPEGSIIRRTHAGAQQRNAGAWSWSIVGPDGRPLDIGSQWPVTLLLADPRPMMITPPNGRDRDTYVDPHEGRP